MDGTYIRSEAGGLFYSNKLSRDKGDPAVSLRHCPQYFEPVLKGGKYWDSDAENEAQYLVPGEWLRIYGPLMEIGGAM